jgi:hypothetical protein
MQKKDLIKIIKLSDEKPEGNKNEKPEGNKNEKPEGNKNEKPEGNKNEKPEGGKHKKYISSPTAVKDMQTEMQNFSKILIPPGSSTQEAESLGYFLIHYPAKSKISTIERGTRGELKTVRYVKDYREAIDSIQKIGRSSAEATPDGVWGRRTQRAILNIALMSGDLLQLAKDIEYKGGSEYSESDKNQLDSLIPQEENPYNSGVRDLGERAEKITPILKKLNEFAQNLHTYLVSRYSQYSEKADPFAETTGPIAPKNFETDEFNSASFEAIKPSSVKYGGKTFFISLKDLSNFDSLKEKISTVLGKNVNIEQWMASDYQKFLLQAKMDIKDDLQKKGQILSEDERKDITLIKKNIAECEDLNARIKESDPRFNWKITINSDLKEPLKNPQIYKSNDGRQELLERSKEYKATLNKQLKGVAALP